LKGGLPSRTFFPPISATFHGRHPPFDHLRFHEACAYRSTKEHTVNTIHTTTPVIDRKIVLSTLWIFAMLNYLYADVFTLFFQPGAQDTAFALPAGAVLMFAVLMETAIAMVLLSRVLKYRANRWANIIAGAFHTLFVAWSLIGSTPTIFYAFFAAIEIACTLFIVWYAWRWRNIVGPA
jgi:hypothetical protein